MNCSFIRCLWGDDQLRWRNTRHGTDATPEGYSQKLKRDLQETLSQEIQTEPVHDYCFGVENQQVLKSLGLGPRLLSPNPLLNPFCMLRKWIDDEEFLRQHAPLKSKRKLLAAYKEFNRAPHGLCHYAHKLAAIQESLTEYDAVVWIDWDLWQHEEIPNGFWEKLTEGPIIRAKLVKTKRRQCVHREKDGHIFSSSSMIYARGMEAGDLLVDTALKWNYLNERVIAIAIEKLAPWAGPEAYRDRGHDLDFFYHRSQYYKPKQVIFTHHGDGANAYAGR